MKDRFLKEYQVARVIYSLAEDIITSDEAQRMKSFCHHGGTSVFEHALSVAMVSYSWALKLESVFGKYDARSLVRGAILHDYFLYDWHIKSDRPKGLHGFTHPKCAHDNASLDFKLNAIEKDVIIKHMFPLTIHPPRFKESWLICLADKWCAICEVFKIDLSSRFIYRINLHSGLARGSIRVG